MLQRMLVDKIENRILVGIVMFLGTMLLVGWVAINENARMASFERQFNARSIERGAALFASNCSGCHGQDARGIAGNAPGLNSPHLFGYDYFAGINRQISALEDQQTAQNDELNAELLTLADELVAEDTTEERATEIEARINEINLTLNGDGTDEISAQIADLEAQRQAVAQQLQPAINNRYPLTLNPDGTVAMDDAGNLLYQPSRLAQVTFGGTLQSYIITTLIHGRPGSQYVGWAQGGMASWSNRTGGPLRDDQIQDLANYILNFDKGENWTVEDALAVNQYARIPADSADVGNGERPEPAGTDVQAILTELDGLEGDAARGQNVYLNRGCSGCHMGGAVAPATEEQWDTIPTTVLTLPEFEGYTIEHYIVESIVQPGAYTVPGYAAGAMPGNFGELLSVQDIADIIAYLQTFSTE